MNLIKRLYNNLNADWDFIKSERISIFVKVRFLFAKYFCIISNRRDINYLGYLYKYDKRLSPLMLEFYPPEINWFDEYINFEKCKSVLVIGENTGQTGFTLKSLFPHLSVYSFEPNPEVFKVLKRNAQKFKNWRTFNFAVGNKTEKREFFVENNSTVGGSFFKDVAGEFVSPGQIKRIQVNVLKLDNKSIAKLRIPNKFDVILIDVEGSESEVLESLSNIYFKFLIVEVAVRSKRMNSQSLVENIISYKLKRRAKLLATKPVGNLGIVANVIYQIS